MQGLTVCAICRTAKLQLPEGESFASACSDARIREIAPHTVSVADLDISVPPPRKCVMENSCLNTLINRQDLKPDKWEGGRME